MTAFIQPKDKRITKAVHLVNMRPGRTIEEIAGEVMLSPSRLLHLFKEETGIKLGAYLVARRLELAAKLLKNTGMRVKEIAYEVGYEHPPSFVRAFKGRYQVTPCAYRTHVDTPYRCIALLDRLARGGNGAESGNGRR